MIENDPTTVERTIGPDENQRAGMDTVTGEFDAILATEGEATDGHILLMRGLEMPDQMPMLFRHDQTQMPLGTLGGFRKKAGALHARGKILVDEGAGEGLDFRRDVAAMVNAGGLPSMSIRWDTMKETRRINLPKDHPHAVDASKTPTDDPRYWGSLIEKSRGREGSIVALPADAGAVIQRSREATSDASAALLSAIGRELEGETEPTGEVLAAFAALRMALDQARGAGLGDESIASFMSEGIDVGLDDLHKFNYTADDGESPLSAYLPRAAWEELRGESLREYQAATAARQEAERESVTTEPEPESETARAIVVPARDESAEILRTLQAFPALLAGEADKILRRAMGRVTR